MIYVQFFNYAVQWNDDMPPRLIPACGTDSVAPLDGRLALANMHKEARRLSLAKKFAGYRIMWGKSFSDGQPLSEVNKLADNGVGETVWVRV